MNYILVIQATRFLRVKIGELGFLRFKPGLYVYVGSAKRNFSSRIKRHLRKKKKKFWHIDYLLSSVSVKIKNVYATSKRSECDLANNMHDFSCVKNFGSSDCKCPSHLFCIKDKKEKFKDFLKRNYLRELRDIYEFKDISR